MKLIIGARKSTHEGMVYPHSFGANNFGECANYITYELIVSTEKTSLLYTYSSSTPPLEVRINENLEVESSFCESKLVKVAETFLNWITTHPEGFNMWALMRGDKDSEFRQFNKVLDHIIDTNRSTNLKIWDLDFGSLGNNISVRNFNGGELQFGAWDIMTKQRPINLAEHPNGFRSTKPLSNGHLHFTVVSLQRCAYQLHFSILHALLTTAIGSEELEDRDVSFQEIVAIFTELEYRLLNVYDRGRAKLLSPAQMLGKFNIPVCSNSRNSNTSYALKGLNCTVNLDYEMQSKVFAKAQAGMFKEVPTKILVISWNVAGYSPSEPNEIEGILQCFDKNNMPDVIAIGLQEVVELKSKNIARFFTSNSKENDDWVRCLMDNIGTFSEEYVSLGSQRMVGLFSLTLVRKSFLPHTFNLGISEVKTGFMGIVGNKGSVIHSMMIEDSLIHLCNTHLPSGDVVSKRASCIRDLYVEFCQEKKCDAFFLFGDLNTRVQLDLLQYKNVMEDYDINNPNIKFDYLMERDEVKQKLHTVLDDQFEEGPLPRAPTYRFVKNTNTFSDERVASWYDRSNILGATESFSTETSRMASQGRTISLIL